MIGRRSLLGFAGVGGFASVTAITTLTSNPAWSQAAPQQIKPYLEVKPVAGDEETVRVFFSPSCPFSKMYFQFFKNLGATIPESKTFEFSPLVNKRDGVGYALAFLAVRRYYPRWVDNFVEASLVGVQDRGLLTRTWGGIDSIGRAAHVPESVPALVSAHAEELRRALLEAIQRQSALAITNTPAVAVGGTYIVTPEFTNGDAAMFSRLVNGVISMAG